MWVIVVVQCRLVDCRYLENGRGVKSRCQCAAHKEGSHKWLGCGCRVWGCYPAPDRIRYVIMTGGLGIRPECLFFTIEKRKKGARHIEK